MAMMIMINDGNDYRREVIPEKSKKMASALLFHVKTQKTIQ
jgi:hypothetical protein